MNKRIKLYAAVALMISANMSMTTFAGVRASGVEAITEGAVEFGPGASITESTGINESTETESGTAEVSLTGNTSGPLSGEAAESAAAEDNFDYYRNLDVSQLDAEHLAILGDFFSNSVIIGDSVAENFQRYNLASGAGDVVSDNFTSLAVAGYSIQKALLPNDGKNIHPMIQGKRYRLPEAISLIGAKHVYSFFGYKDLNDVWAADNYEKLLQEIQAVNPEADITVISTTYMTKGYQNAEYNNDKVRALNEAMKLKCAANGWGFIDVQDIMSDGAGNLPDDWSIDKQIHYNYQYYIYWVNEMKRFALEKLGVK